MDSSPDDADVMRQELSKYLDSMQHKTDEDGAPLFTYPKNFESIAAAMDRDDLVSEQEKPWSRYLLEQNMPSSVFDQDPNDDVDEKAREERKLQQGLAEIQLLDKQLKAAAKKEAPRRQSSPSLSLEDAVFAREDDINSAPSTGRSSAASSRYGGGKTFLTRLKSDVYLGEDSRLNSARTDHTEDRTMSNTPRKPIPAAQGSPTVDLANSLLHNEEEGASDVYRPDEMPRPPSHPSSVKATAPPKKNFLEDNRQAIQGRSRLNHEQQMRVSAILGFDDMELGEDENFSELEKLADENFEAQWKQISMYGYNEDERRYVEQLDAKLGELRGQEFVEQHGGGPATSQTPVGTLHETTSAESKIKQENYLIAQRAERTREAYTNQLDIAIRSMKRPMTAEMMAGLVSCADESAMGAAGGGAALTPDIRGSRARSSRWSTAKASRELGKCRSVHDLPKVDDVSPAGMISMDEVLDVIDELCHQDHKSSESDSGVSSSRAHGQALAPRSEIDILLNKLKPEIIQLSSLRNRQRDHESRHKIMSMASEVPGRDSGFDSTVDCDDNKDRLDGFLEMESVSHAPLGVEEIAANAAKFAQISAVAASELSEQHRPVRKKAKSSRVRKEIGVMSNNLLDPRKSDKPNFGKEFDISRNAVASEIESGSLRPTIRMRAEKCGEIASGEMDRESRMSCDDGEEIIYSAPSSSQSSRRNTPQEEYRDHVSYYQSSRRQQAAREHSRSREGASVEQDMSSKGFLPALPGTSRPPLENSSSKIADSTKGQGRRVNLSREPSRKIGSKLSSAVVQPELSSKVDSPLKVGRTQLAVDESAAVDSSTKTVVQQLDRQPSKEIHTVSTGLDDVHRKLSRLLARADRAQDDTEEDFSLETDRYHGDIAKSEAEFGEVQLSGIMQNFLNHRSEDFDSSTRAVDSSTSVPSAAENESYVVI